MTDIDRENKQRSDEAKAKAKAQAKQRVIEEAEELKAKADRLEAFINGPSYHDVNDHQKGLLKAQLSAMHSYWQILQQRLKAWD